MKVLMIMPSMDNGYWKKLGKKVGPKSEPLSLLYIATFLNNHGHEVQVLDCEAEGVSFEELEAHIREGNYDVIGVAMLTPMYSQALETCKVAKKVNPNIKVLVGGSHPSLRPKETAEEECIDVATIGEAETTFLELLDAFTNNKSLKDIKGIAFKDDKKVIQTPDREKTQDLDSFPIPDRGLINMKLYRPSASYYKQLPAYTMITTRGCPYRCTFCATAKTGYRMHSVPRVVEEMKILIDEYNAKEVLIRDDTFTLNRKRTIDLCNAIIKAGLHKKVRWDCITRANLIDYGLLKKMKEAGCWGMHFGVEGGTQELIDSIKKDSTLEIIKKAFRLCRSAGIETRAYMMLGMPGSKKEDDLTTIKFAKELDPDWAQFTICTPYPGTQMYDQLAEQGEVISQDWDNFQTWSGYSDHTLVWTPKNRTSEEIKNLQKQAMREFYFRPKIILRKLTNLKDAAMLKNYIKGALAIG
jgi:anaerobic magnesium-protoporphyrin IX monomethyl ester cyclase